MRVLAVIPARGGSKGLPGKNLRQLGGIPLIAHAIRCAQSASAITRVVTTTDAADIARVASDFGCEVMHRPEILAADHSNVVDAVIHVLDNLDEPYDVVVLLQPTSPLRTSNDIEAVIGLLLKHPEADAVVSVVQVDDAHPARMYTLKPDARLVPFDPVNEATRRQELEAVFLRNGCFYAIRTEALRKYRSFMVPDKLAYVMPLEWLANVDTLRDFKITEVLYETWKNENPDYGMH